MCSNLPATASLFDITQSHDVMTQLPHIQVHTERTFFNGRYRGAKQKRESLSKPPPGLCVSRHALLRVFWAQGYANQTGNMCNGDPPVYGEHHFLHASLNSVLCLQVSHALRWLPVNGDDHVSDAQVSSGCFTSRSDLPRQHSWLKQSFFFSSVSKRRNGNRWKALLHI